MIDVVKSPTYNDVVVGWRAGAHHILWKRRGDVMLRSALDDALNDSSIVVGAAM